MIHIVSAAGLLAALVSTSAHADQREDLIRTSLQEFDSNTADFMRKIPEKSVAGNPAPPRIDEVTSKYELINAEISRLEEGRAAPQARLNLLGPIGEDDRAEDLVDRLQYRTPQEMDTAGLASAKLEVQPWSDTYWPIAKGVLAWRYGDPEFPNSFDWKENSVYLSNPQNSCSVDQLSPAEKYDLLVGDSRQTLTHAMLKEGQGYYNNHGKVEAWMGICHGWAPASYMAGRPAKTLEALAEDGRTRIHFFPSDIKALTSLLWAKGQFENRFIGERCDNQNPPMDENGRITDPACYGENPGTWHLSVVNQIGVSHRSFVMDALHDTEIWNQPILGYHYSYFNPQTKAPVKNLSEAEVESADYTADKFKRYRSPKARSFVGIAMDLTYVAENTPTSAPTDSAANDALITVHYLYDLELGSNHEILGGEWYSNAHPGFLWTPVVGAHAVSSSEPQGDWDGKSPVPATWLGPIARTARLGTPVAKIVDTLGILASLD
ncbi:MAG: hypothetical protein ACXWP5_09175 [Bdellovibrionota bacterium]